MQIVDCSILSSRDTQSKQNPYKLWSCKSGRARVRVFIIIIIFKPRHSFSHFILATILEKCLTKTFESTTAFIKATQVERDKSDSQSLTNLRTWLNNGI